MGLPVCIHVFSGRIVHKMYVLILCITRLFRDSNGYMYGDNCMDYSSAWCLFGYVYVCDLSNVPNGDCIASVVHGINTNDVKVYVINIGSENFITGITKDCIS